MAETNETQESVPTSPSPLEVQWFKELKDGTGAAEYLDPDLREALGSVTVDRATELAEAADRIPWRKDLLEGSGTAKDLSPQAREALIEATRPAAVAGAGDFLAWEDELKAARDIATKISDKQVTEPDTPQDSNPHDPNS